MLVLQSKHLSQSKRLSSLAPLPWKYHLLLLLPNLLAAYASMSLVLLALVALRVRATARA